MDNLNNNRDMLYEFPAAGRLLYAKAGTSAGATGVTANWTQTYTYDRYGNKTATSVSGDLEDTTRAPRDGLSSVSVNTATNRVNTSGWEYDLTGNLIRGKDGTAWQKFEYDAAGRLVKIRNDSNVLLEEYTYGASRERLKVETSSQRRYFAWGGQNVVAEYVETGSGTTPDYSKSYIYAGSRLFMTATKASSTTETKEFHHPDRLGTQLVTEGSTGSSFRQSTMPFGTAISTETTGNTNQVFTSYDRSSTTGLDYAQNRTYSKGQSRFTQVDPIQMASASLGSPQSNNLFAYVQNMPTDFSDPKGLNAITPYAIVRCEPDRWDVNTQTLYAGQCYIVLSGGGGTVGTGITLQPPIEVGNAGGGNGATSTTRCPPPKAGTFYGDSSQPDVYTQALADMNASNGQEQGGWVYQNLRNGSLKSVRKRLDSGDSQNMVILASPPSMPGWQVVGTFHTHNVDVGPSGEVEFLANGQVSASQDYLANYSQRVPGLVLTNTRGGGQGNYPYGPDRGIFNVGVPRGC